MQVLIYGSHWNSTDVNFFKSRRKIKCDRAHPCGQCALRGEHDKCSFVENDSIDRASHLRHSDSFQKGYSSSMTSNKANYISEEAVEQKSGKPHRTSPLPSQEDALDNFSSSSLNTSQSPFVSRSPDLIGFNTTNMIDNQILEDPSQAFSASSDLLGISFNSCSPLIQSPVDLSISTARLLLDSQCSPENFENFQKVSESIVSPSYTSTGGLDPQTWQPLLESTSDNECFDFGVENILINGFSGPIQDESLVLPSSSTADNSFKISDMVLQNAIKLEQQFGFGIGWSILQDNDFNSYIQNPIDPFIRKNQIIHSIITSLPSKQSCDTLIDSFEARYNFLVGKVVHTPTLKVELAQRKYLC